MKGRLMGSFAEECAKKYGFSRAEQDGCHRVTEAAQKAIDTGAFKEIEPVTVKSRKAIMSWIWMSSLETLNSTRFLI